MKMIVVCGATATGKSELAVSLAQRYDGEIINADSMQIYRGMDIGTAKLKPHDRGGVPHHLLDVLEVSQDSTVAWYQGQAREKVAQIRGRDKSVIIVGGTGLYIKALIDELNFPDTDPAIRQSLNELAEKIGADALHQRLSALDPAAGLAIDSQNLRRVIRALEVIEITGKPFTANLPRKESTRYPDAKLIGLVMDRETLDARISDRVEKMWRDGFVEEVEQLILAGLTVGRTAQLALGYSQILKFRAGLLSEADAIEDTKRATRQYARRQETWFSRDERIQWISPKVDRLHAVAEIINRPIALIEH